MSDSFEKEKQRKLSAAEEKRSRKFAEISEKYISQGYRRTELMIGIVRANVIALLLGIPYSLIAVILYFRINEGRGLSFRSGAEVILFLVLQIVLTAVHEAIHGITWSFFAENGFKDIEFGFMKEYLTPYCTCTVPLKKAQYVTGTLMPLLVLGILPTVISFFTASALLLYTGIVMTYAAGGDIMIAAKLLMHRSSSKDILAADHPTQAGCVVFER